MIKTIAATVNCVVDEANASTNVSEATVLTIEQIVSNNGAKRIYLNFPIQTNSILPAHKIRDAYITMNCTAGESGADNVTAKRTTSAWDASTTWNTKPTVAAGSWAGMSANLPTGTGNWTIPVTALLRDALDAEQTSLGVELSLTSEASAGVVLATFDSIAGGTDPTLTVSYYHEISESCRGMGTVIA